VTLTVSSSVNLHLPLRSRIAIPRLEPGMPLMRTSYSAVDTTAPHSTGPTTLSPESTDTSRLWGTRCTLVGSPAVPNSRSCASMGGGHRPSSNASLLGYQELGCLGLIAGLTRADVTTYPPVLGDSTLNLTLTLPLPDPASGYM